VRKARRRARAEAVAAENRVLHGRTKAQKALARREAETAARALDQRILVRTPKGDGESKA
jgi:hypothetical protein